MGVFGLHMVAPRKSGNIVSWICTQELGITRASRTPLHLQGGDMLAISRKCKKTFCVWCTHSLTGTGALNLRSPTGGSAKGIPQNMSTSLPWSVLCRAPLTFPVVVLITRLSGSSAAPPDSSGDSSRRRSREGRTGERRRWGSRTMAGVLKKKSERKNQTWKKRLSLFVADIIGSFSPGLHVVGSFLHDRIH